MTPLFDEWYHLTIHLLKFTEKQIQLILHIDHEVKLLLLRLNVHLYTRQLARFLKYLFVILFFPVVPRTPMMFFP